MSIVYNGSKLLVDCLIKQGVKRIFGIPGAKIDAVFDALLDSPIQFVLCRHEQNAAFMAAAYGRLTGEPGVVLVTSGPGISNLATGLLTATTEGDPIIAIGANVSQNTKYMSAHQGANNIKLMAGVTKAQMEVPTVESIPEILELSFRIAKTPRSGAVFISLPQNISLEPTNAKVFSYPSSVLLGPANIKLIEETAKIINEAKKPLLLVGQESSRLLNSMAIRSLVEKTSIPVICTYQATGVVSKNLVSYFGGRVGLFKNQPGDLLINESDLIITVGFNSVEYEPEAWNDKNNCKIIHIDYNLAEVREKYSPIVELIGDIAETITTLIPLLKKHNCTYYESAHHQLIEIIEQGKQYNNTPIHPLRFIYELQQVVDENAIISVDIGSVYMWMARYFLSFQPHHLLFSNGQQTLGVALPWAISAKLIYPQKTIISVSGDGGFLFSSMELETAVREKLHIIHFVWVDGSYDMVKEQQLMKYNRESAVQFGAVDLVKYAESFGAKGYKIATAEQLVPIMKEALSADGPVLVEIPIDYKHNPELFKTVIDSIHN